MAANYLHGAEVIEVEFGGRTIRVIKSAVITLVGIAPIGVKNVPTLCVSPKDAAQFGSPVTGFTIPQALSAIFAQGPNTVVVVNVYDPATDVATVALETHTVTNRAVKLAFAPIGGVDTVDIFEADGTTDAGLVLNTDYTIDDYGNVAFISAEAPDATVLKFTYKKLDLAQVTTGQMIGAVAGDGSRTGFQCLDLVYSTFGFSPKIIIAPGFSHVDAIAAEMRSKADKFRAVCLCDSPFGKTPQEALAGRGPLGSIPTFNTSTDRAYLLYPGFKAYDVATNSNITVYQSAYIAGLIGFVDYEEGYYQSPSNHEVKGIVGLERHIEASIDDPTCEANLLNEAGIATNFNGFGTGFRLWGNRSAAWPSNTTPKNFLCVRRTADVIHESIILSMLQFIDKPINQAVIDAIRDSVNGFIRTLIAQGALIDGECKFLKENNPDTELANGHLTFDIEMMPPTPAERITFNSFINIALLKSLV